MTEITYQTKIDAPPGNSVPRYGKFLRSMTIVLLVGSLSGCQLFSRLANVGDGPQVTPISNPVAAPNYQPVVMPMPAPMIVEENPNSLWRAGAKAFFKDHRAKEVGDILRVNLNLNDAATLSNVTTRARADTEDANLTDFLGWENHLNELPFVRSGAAEAGLGVLDGNLATFGSTHNTSGTGGITRSEVVTLELAAVVTQILPNGNLVIMGRQEVKVNNELRELMVTGIVRTSDIDTNNTIAHTRIAEMRVAYGGQGSLSEMQQPRWGMQVWDIIFPF